MKLDKTCCCKALKHGQTVCPVCGQELLKKESTQNSTEIERDGQIALLLGKPKQLVINFNQRTK